MSLATTCGYGEQTTQYHDEMILVDINFEFCRSNLDSLDIIMDTTLP